MANNNQICGIVVVIAMLCFIGVFLRDGQYCFGEPTHLAPPRNTEQLNYDEQANQFFRYIEQTQMVCQRIERMGFIRDGGWEVCADPKYKPIAPCLVYSFGINNDFSFDDDVSKRFGCKVHAFDPSMKQQHEFNRSALVTFHPIGLANFDGISKVKRRNWTVRRLKTIMAELRHTNLDILKIDIEGWEWKVFSDILSTLDMKIGFQLLIEIHVSGGARRDWTTNFSILQSLYDKGLRLFVNRRNPACGQARMKVETRMVANCQEMHFVKIK